MVSHSPPKTHRAAPPPGFEQQRGDMQSIAKKHRRVPDLRSMVLLEERANELHNARRRRDLNAEYCFGGGAQRDPAVGVEGGGGVLGIRSGVGGTAGR